MGENDSWKEGEWYFKIMSAKNKLDESRETILKTILKNCLKSWSVDPFEHKINQPYCNLS